MPKNSGSNSSIESMKPPHLAGVSRVCQSQRDAGISVMD
jgi:hypothetical protein